MDDQEAREAVEFDLQNIGIDLRDVYRGRLSIRRLRVLVKGLPASCRLWSLMRRRLREDGEQGTAIEDLPPEVWSETDWQLADLRDRIAMFMWMYSAAHRGPNDPEPPRPDMVPRPGGEKKRNRTLKVWFGLGAQ